MSGQQVTPMSGVDRYDVVVIGAGVIGSAAAYHCALDGKRVLVLEQFVSGNKLGSSHGESRIYRQIHNKMSDARLMPATQELWRRFERDSGCEVLTMTGGLFMTNEPDSWIGQTIGTLDELGWEYRVLRGEELRESYPQFSLSDEWLAIEQADAGILSPAKTIPALLAEAVKRGATVRENCAVGSIAEDGEGVTVCTATGEAILAERVIVAAGPWASRFLKALVPFKVPLAVTRQQVVYFPVSDPSLFARGRCPVYVTAGKPHIYGFPIFEIPGAIKISLANDTKFGTDPDYPRAVQDAMVAELCDIVSTHMVGVTPKPVSAEACLYTETPTSAFIVDRHPTLPQIVLAAGFSGRGFKHAIAIGRLLADLVAGGPADYSSPLWNDDYRIGRFS